MRILVIILLMTTSAYAQSPWPQQPPPRYEHAYKGRLNVVMAPRGTVRQMCYKLAGQIMPDNTNACALVGSGHCTIVLPEGSDPALLAVLRRHEMAHCNGWSSNHQ